MNLKTTKGFTIVELLIVIVVIAILAAISIVAYTGVQENSRNTQRVSNAKTVIDAANAYYAEKGEWPTAAQLGSYGTVKISTEVAGKLTNAVTASADNKDEIDYTPGASGAAPSIRYYVKPIRNPNCNAGVQSVTLQ